MYRTVENAYRYSLPQFRNTWVIIHVKRVNKEFSYREQNALSIIKTDELLRYSDFQLVPDKL